MATQKYPIHEQYLRMSEKLEILLNNFKNKSAVLIVNDTVIPPINYERTDLPWALGSKAHPWKNIYLCNCAASELTPTREEVIDVYSKLYDAASNTEFIAFKNNVETYYATKEYVDSKSLTIEAASTTAIGGIKLKAADWVAKLYNINPEVDPLESVYCRTNPKGNLEVIDPDDDPEIPYWDAHKALYYQDNPYQEWVDENRPFSWKTVEEQYPEKYDPEFANANYVLVYKDTSLLDPIFVTCKYVPNKDYNHYPSGSVQLTAADEAYVDLAWGELQGTIRNQTDLIDFINSSVQSGTGGYCGSWDTWVDVPTTVEGFTSLGLASPDKLTYLVVREDESLEHKGATWRYKYPSVVDSSHPYSKNNWSPEYKINDTPFTATQLAAINSNITKEKVDKYEEYETKKANVDDVSPKNHADTTDKYGAGSNIKLGHVKNLTELKNLEPLPENGATSIDYVVNNRQAVEYELDDGTTLIENIVMCDYVPPPKAIKFLDNYEFSVVKPATYNGTIEFSTDGITWTEFSGTVTYANGALNDDGKYVLYIRGKNNTKVQKFEFAAEASSVLDVSGNLNYLLDYTNDSNTLAENSFSNLFENTTLVSADKLELPWTTVVKNCYTGMFRGCSHLINAPQLPATTLAEGCYQYMFYGCTSLTTAPALPATVMEKSCYMYMFANCSSLLKPPVLPATTLDELCYTNMFDGCSSLNAINALPALTMADACYSAMYMGCTNIKISATQDDTYTTEYRLPVTGDGVTASEWNVSMLTNTGGTFKSNPAINTTYYTANEVI